MRLIFKFQYKYYSDFTVSFAWTKRCFFFWATFSFRGLGGFFYFFKKIFILGWTIDLSQCELVKGLLIDSDKEQLFRCSLKIEYQVHRTWWNLSSVPAWILRKLPVYSLEACKKVRCLCHRYYTECGRPLQKVVFPASTWARIPILIIFMWLSSLYCPEGHKNPQQ